MFEFLKNVLTPKTEKQRIEQYLAESVDLVDLENRIRYIDRRQAPWQIQATQNLKGWPQ